MKSGKICPVEEVFHIPGDLNLADLATHSRAKLAGIGARFEWQKGPLFLTSRRELWPITRNFISVELPEDEVRSAKSNKFAAMKVVAGLCKSHLKSSVPNSLVLIITSIFSFFNLSLVVLV